MISVEAMTSNEPDEINIPSLREKEICAICLDAFSAGNVYYLILCRHGFHVTCLREMIDYGYNRCCLCKRPFSTKEMTAFQKLTPPSPASSDTSTTGHRSVVRMHSFVVMEDNMSSNEEEQPRRPILFRGLSLGSILCVFFIIAVISSGLTLWTVAVNHHSSSEIEDSTSRMPDLPPIIYSNDSKFVNSNRYLIETMRNEDTDAHFLHHPPSLLVMIMMDLFCLYRLVYILSVIFRGHAHY